MSRECEDSRCVISTVKGSFRLVNNATHPLPPKLCVFIHCNNIACQPSQTFLPHFKAVTILKQPDPVATWARLQFGNILLRKLLTSPRTLTRSHAHTTTRQQCVPMRTCTMSPASTPSLIQCSLSNSAGASKIIYSTSPARPSTEDHASIEADPFAGYVQLPLRLG